MSSLFLGLLIFFELCADVAAKEFSLDGKVLKGLLAIFLYVAANTSWLISLKYKSNLAVGANIFSVSTGLLAVLVGVFMYGEALETKQYVGVALGVVSITLLL